MPRLGALTFLEVVNLSITLQSALYPPFYIFTFNQPRRVWLYSTVVSEKKLFVSRPLKLLLKGSTEFAYHLHFITYFK